MSAPQGATFASEPHSRRLPPGPILASCGMPVFADLRSSAGRGAGRGWIVFLPTLFPPPVQMPGHRMSARVRLGTR